MFGSHLSIAGSMVNALHEGEKLGLDTVQVFTKNQQQWKAKPLDEGMVREWRAEIARLGWDRGGPGDAKGGGGRTVSHASYLINLASPDKELWRKSVDLMRDEIERCEQLGIPFLVHHPGSFTTSCLDDGCARIADAYEELFRSTAGYATVSCLEDTVGSGRNLGGPFEELARLRELIIERTGRPERIGFCLDTCHMHAAGYDLSNRARAREALDAFDAIAGLRHVKAMHINDSKGAAGSHLDRHMHIGEGTIGGGTTPKQLRASGFAEVINRPELAALPLILETPKGETGSGTPFDTINLERLRGLIESPKAASKPSRAEPPPARERRKVRSPARAKARRSR
ncbi:MAG: deoxyribonuclease IV [Phycisphaerales bacterium]|nr:deoxyribonuclease IV [Phycisphaerales bacterium]